MSDHEFIAAMKAGIPPIPAPTALAPAEILKGNADIATHNPDAIGAEQELLP